MDIETKLLNVLDSYDEHLKRLAEFEGAFEGVLDDDMPDAFDTWFAEQNDLVDLTDRLLNFLK